MWNILIVDDDANNCKLLKEALKGKAVCEIAFSGEEALTAFKQVDHRKPFDAILLDIAMPEMDGMEVLKQVREFERSKGILLGDGVPVLMLTAFKQYAMKSFGVGCDDFMVKPLDPKKLVEKLTQFIKLR